MPNSFDPTDQTSVQLERIERRLAVVQKLLEKDPNALRDMISITAEKVIQLVTAEAVARQSKDIRELIRQEISNASINMRFY